MKERNIYPAGERIQAVDSIRHLDDLTRKNPITGTSLGMVHYGRDGTIWLAVHWDDEADPNWFKLHSLAHYQKHKKQRKEPPQ